MPFCHLKLKARKPRDPAYPKELDTLGDHLRAVRLDRGLLQREVAAQLGVNLFTVIHWERGKTTPPVRYVPRLIAFLGYCPWEPAKHLGDVLRQVRVAAGLSQEQFGAGAATDPATVSRWEAGKRRLPRDLVDWLHDPTQPIPCAGRSACQRTRARRRGS